MKSVILFIVQNVSGVQNIVDNFEQCGQQNIVQYCFHQP